MPGPYLPTNGPTLLSDVAWCTPWLRIARNRRDRQGRLSVARLIHELGAGTKAWDAVVRAAADCPRRQEERQVYERCGVHCPTFSKFMEPVAPVTPRSREWHGGRR